MAELQLPKLTTRVRFPSSAPTDTPCGCLFLLEQMRSNPSHTSFAQRYTSVSHCHKHLSCFACASGVACKPERSKSLLFSRRAQHIRHRRNSFSLLQIFISHLAATPTERHFILIELCHNLFGRGAWHYLCDIQNRSLSLVVLGFFMRNTPCDT